MKYFVLLSLISFLFISNLVLGQERTQPQKEENQTIDYSNIKLRSVFTITIEKESGNFIDFNVTAIPISDFIVITSTYISSTPYYYKIYNKEGNLIKKDKLNGDETLIDLSKILPATYYLKITDNQKDLKAYKIVKH